MGYSLSTKSIELRAAEMLERTGDPLGNDPYYQIAPGLYPDETLYEIDGAGTVAVSVETRRLENGGGLAITGWARAVEDDGQTLLDGHGSELETCLPCSFDWGAVAARTQSVLEREVLLAVMGEPGGSLPADQALELPERPILECDRASASIVNAVSAAANAGSGDPAALLA